MKLSTLLLLLLFLPSCSLFGGAECTTSTEFADMSDRDLWACLEESGRTSIVGVKNPGDASGVGMGTVLVSDGNYVVYFEQISNIEGTLIGDRLGQLPAAVVEFDRFSTFAQVRSLETVDYVEPSSFIR